MTQAIRLHAPGGPEMLRFETLPTPEPRPGEVLVHHTAIGLNYIDVYFRTGLYKTALPAILGMEAAGEIAALGDGVTEWAVGDHVAYASGPIGAYATERVLAADRLIRVPPTVPLETAAAVMLQGLTAQYLLRRTFRVQRGQTILVHAAAGGVGLLLCQWAAYLGARVIGVVSTPEKAAIAVEHGASEVIVGHADLPAAVARLTGGAKVPVVYDSVGRDTFMDSLDCLAPLGLMVSYGQASGPVPPVDIGLLAAKGSLFLTRPSLASYTASRADLVASAAELFEVLASGAVSVRIGQRFALRDAAAAHAALEARATTGSTLLLP
jgi:NADPH2:quinone reductase